MVALVFYKYKEEPIKNEEARLVTGFFPIITLWELSVAMETRILIQSSPNLMQHIPHTNDVPDEI